MHGELNLHDLQTPRNLHAECGVLRSEYNSKLLRPLGCTMHRGPAGGKEVAAAGSHMAD